MVVGGSASNWELVTASPDKTVTKTETAKAGNSSLPRRRVSCALSVIVGVLEGGGGGVYEHLDV